MGLFNWFRKQKKEKPVFDSVTEKQEEIGQKEKQLTQLTNEYPSIEMGKATDLKAVADQCEQMLEANRQMEQIKFEYQSVTSYLSDIQKIETAANEEKEVIEKAAADITMFQKERDRCRNKEVKLSKAQRATMERYEKDMMREIKNMKHNESFQGMIKSDLTHLEGEKRTLMQEQQEIKAKQEYLKKIATATAVLVVSLLILIMILATGMNFSMALPFILTIAMASFVSLYIVIESNKNRRNMLLAEKKLYKCIGLLNKVKIKYVNNRSLLDYSYEKFGVESFVELEFVWKQYTIVRENERKYALNTEKMHNAGQILMVELSKIGLMDSEVWIHQAEAINDSREMVEVRHRLNVRRQKLRDNLDYNSKNYEASANEIASFVKENQSLKQEVHHILQNYGIDLKNT